MQIYPYTFSRPGRDQIDIGTYIKAAKKDYATIQSYTTESGEEDAIYIYRILKNDRSYLGFVALCNVEDYDNGNMIRHELTIHHKQENQKLLLDQRKALIKPILLTYSPDNEIEEILSKYCKKHKADEHYLLKDGSIHEKWMVNKKKWIKKLQKKVQGIPEMYIADGHHRSAAFSAQRSENPNGKYERLMCAFFSLENLEIKSFHRIITDEQIISNRVQLFDRLSELFHIEDIDDPRAQTDIELPKHELFLYIPNQWKKLKWKDNIIEAVNDPLVLDADLFNRYVCEKIFHCKDIREDSRISYQFSTAGLPKLIEETHLRNHSMSFILPKMSKEEFHRLVEKRTILPPKSTLFEPRLKNGLIIQEL